jgi:hypothetical protein
LLEYGPEGQAFAEAWVLIAEARKHLATSANAAVILGLGRAALAHAQCGHLLSTEPAEQFLAARIEDVTQFADSLESGAATQTGLGTLLIAVEFVLRAAQYQVWQKSRANDAPMLVEASG